MRRRSEGKPHDHRVASRLFDKVVGSRLAARRQKSNLHAEAAAERLGTNTDKLYRLERGSTPAKPYELDQMARLYGCKVGDFINEINIEALLK